MRTGSTSTARNAQQGTVSSLTPTLLDQEAQILRQPLVPSAPIDFRTAKNAASLTNLLSELPIFVTSAPMDIILSRFSTSIMTLSAGEKLM